jgi:hypothetical protein
MTELPPATVIAGVEYGSAANAPGAAAVSEAATATAAARPTAASILARDRAMIACLHDLLMLSLFPQLLSNE